MDEGELFAIETFGTTGKGTVYEAGDCSHYMKNYDSDVSGIPLRNPKSKALLAEIDSRFGTLAWCRRWIE
jgi:methionyl aminopeptidase